jgi:hypothetical protein
LVNGFIHSNNRCLMNIQVTFRRKKNGFVFLLTVLPSSTSLYPTQEVRKEELEGGEERKKEAKAEDR